MKSTPEHPQLFRIWSLLTLSVCIALLYYMNIIPKRYTIAASAGSSWHLRNLTQHLSNILFTGSSQEELAYSNKRPKYFQIKKTIPDYGSTNDDVWVTVAMAGRLGNQMCAYAHLKNLQLKYGVKVYLRNRFRANFQSIFPNISIPSLPRQYEQIRIKYDLVSEITKKLEKNTLVKPIGITGFPCFPSKLWSERSLWRKEFNFDKNVKIKTKKRINWTISKWRKKTNVTDLTVVPTIVTVHVRRQDYLQYMVKFEGTVPETDFLQAAFEFFKARLKHVVFLIISDDLKWCNKHLPSINDNVVIADKAFKPVHDLSLIAYGSHVIMTVGTFGLWGAMLSHGNITITKNKISKKPYWLLNDLRRIKDPTIINIISGY